MYTRSITPLSGVLVLEPEVFEDERGFFLESYNARSFLNATGLDLTFVQDNHSSSRAGTIRGLHYQLKRPQGKLVRVIKGSVFDVCVDLRFSSQTYGQWFGINLSASNRRHLWIPPGFAHGFLTTSDRAETIYKTTEYWDPADERVLLWSDTTLGIEWPVTGTPIVSSKDKQGKLFCNCDIYA